MSASFRVRRMKYHLIYFSRLLVMAGITLLSGAVIAAAGVMLASLLTDVPQEMLQNYRIEDLKDPSLLAALRILQTASQIGFFLIPALIFPMLYGRSPVNYLWIRKKINLRWVLFSIAGLILMMPIVQGTMTLNEAISFPDAWKNLEESLRSQHSHIEELSRAFIEMPDIQRFLLNVLLVAVLPAIAEEFFFRGMLQNFFYKWTSRPHLSIWISAVLFSAVHFQFFSLLPRIVLGAFFGYLLLYSRNIWYPVIAHFLNNFLLLCLVYFGYEPMAEAVKEVIALLLPFVG